MSSLDKRSDVSMDDNSKFHTTICTCDSCRRGTGMEFIEWALVPTTDIWLDENMTVPFRFDFGTMQHYP